MSLNAYQVFVAIAERGSFASAAHQLNLSPSAVSHALASFEKELGFTLFGRTRSGARLTAGGEALLPTVREVLQCNDKLRQQAAELLGFESGTVRIGAFTCVSVAWLPKIIRSFATRYPQIEVSIEQGAHDDVAKWVMNSRVDLGFTIFPAPPGLESTPLYADPLMCIAPLGFAPKGKACITVPELTDHNVVLQEENQGKETEKVLANHKISIRSGARAIDDAAILAMVESGLGLSVMPQLALLGHKSAVQVLPLYPLESRVIVLASLGQQSLAPATKAMHQHIEKFVAGWSTGEDCSQS
ncbi:LysR family transcriptional regulator [Bradyrhizobium sp. B124]|uniref:LysR family transcriptional regulator n=1 Tax=Bradyrhizobium sp. B124 TaxID=3140245 RepID=UPI003183CE36